jgi:hypothetical protein
MVQSRQAPNQWKSGGVACYSSFMTETELLAAVMPSATPSDAEIAAWQALPRDEQLRRLRAALSDADCSEASPSTMSDILNQARDAAKRRHG